MQDEDIKAGTAAGIIDENQAARLMVLVNERQGRRALNLSDDEPFELFQGFSEIFISIGLIILISGVAAFSVVAGGVFVYALVLIVSCWGAAQYFTVKRRMTLPSIVLVIGYAQGVTATLLLILGDVSGRGVVVVFGAIGIAAMIAHYRFFRVPFSMFLAGLFGLATVFGLFADTGLQIDPVRGFDTSFLAGGSFGWASLIFGALALTAALWFDLRDPHRVGRLARSAFWLHVLAAPALVHTIMLTFYRLEGVTGTILTMLGFAIIACFALIIDRRSFITAALGYVGALLFVALNSADWGLGIPTFMLILGLFMTSLGTFWTNLRVGLMNRLPNFPGKDRLPPYMESP